ncbi:MAG: heavy metal-binding domain-containing protein [Bacteroidales bacterium]
MKTKIITILLASMISGTMVFAQSHIGTVKKQSPEIKTGLQKDSVYFTCTMNTDIKMDKPGKCPKCGMKLEKRTIIVKDIKNEKKGLSKTYICPMHIGVKMDKPGICPKCGLDLKEEKVNTLSPSTL